MNSEQVFSFSVQISPYAMEKIEEAKNAKTRFSHYTSAYVATEIIERNEVWLRNALVMNDFSEVQHGHFCLSEAWKDQECGGRLRTILEGLKSGLADEVEAGFDQRRNDRSAQSYLVSISEHGNGTMDEDQYGRLSMWRAYGGENNVAFVFKNTPFLSESKALMAFTSPVLYADSVRFKKEFKRVVDNLETHRDLALAIGPDLVKQVIENAFHFAALSTKHPGFAEEREWRVIYSPTLWKSDRIQCSVASVGGVPQRIYKIPLQNFPEDGFVGATLPELLDEIIIGPTENAFAIYDALVLKLEAAGVPKAWEKVRRSGIPLRR